MRPALILAVLIAVLATAACAGEQDVPTAVPPTAVQTSKAAADTPTPEPTLTPTPTPQPTPTRSATPQSSQTPTPSPTLKPTPTPTATAVPEPTALPPPTFTPKPTIAPTPTAASTATPVPLYLSRYAPTPRPAATLGPPLTPDSAQPTKLTAADECGWLCLSDLWWDELNSMPDTDFTALLQAILESGAKYPTVDYPYVTPIEQAARYALHPEIFRLLLEHGADPNYYNGSEPPLTNVASRAARLSNPAFAPEEVARFHYYASSEERVAWLETLTPNGIEEMLVEAIRALLKYGADPWLGSMKGKSAVTGYFLEFWGSDDGRHNPEIVQMLLEGGEYRETILFGDRVSGQSWLMMMSTVTGADSATIRVLLENGLPADLAVSEGWTWLHFMAFHGAEVEVFELLLDSGANVSAENVDGNTPCDLIESEWFGAGAGHEEDVRKLLCR